MPPFHIPDTGGVDVDVSGIGWDSITTPSSSNVWRDVTYSPDLDLFCAVADSGASVNLRAMTSADASDGSWTLRTLDDTYAWRGVAWSSELNLFAAVSNSPSHAATSPDGITWTLRAGVPAENIAFVDVLFGNSLFVACGDGVGSGSLGFKIATSPDGITWTRRHAGTNRNLSSIAFDPVGVRFVVVSTTSGADQVGTSDDGITWASAAASSAQ